MALLDDSPRSATIRAKMDALLLRLHRDDFHQILPTSPEVASALPQLLGQKIRGDTPILRQQEQFQYDLRQAHEIQTAMLPSEDLILDWIHLTGKIEPTAVVGGDYSDYFCLPVGYVSLAIGDVAGHRFYCSSLVAIISSTLRLQIEIDYTPDSVILALNKVVRNYRHTRMLMAFSYLSIDLYNHAFTFINAGQPYPYLYRHDEQRWKALELNSLPLGTYLAIQPMPIEVEWKSGDRLFLYSDGLIETGNDSGKMHGVDSLQCFFASQRDDVCSL